MVGHQEEDNNDKDFLSKIYKYLFTNKILSNISNAVFSCNINDFKKNIKSVNYNNNNIIIIKGDVCKTLLERYPNKISILRLDTDFYKSTKCELEQLFPKIVSGGYLIIDDYYTFKGSKKATDEYLKNKKHLVKELNNYKNNDNSINNNNKKIYKIL